MVGEGEDELLVAAVAQGAAHTLGGWEVHLATVLPVPQLLCPSLIAS